MFWNYFKTAFRFLVRNKVYTIVNMAGLSIGVAICIILFLIIQFELSFDRFHKKEAQIYRVLSQYKEPSGLTFGAGVPFPLAKALRQDIPQIQEAASIYCADNVQFQLVNNASIRFREETGVYYMEPAFFAIFDFKWLAGTASTSLAEPNSVVLTKDIAQKYFGDWKAAVGQSIRQGNNPLKITGILENPPLNTDFQFKYLISYNSLKNGNLQDWETINSNVMCYVLISGDSKPASINNQLGSLLKKYKKEANAHVGHLLQPLKEVHFDTQTSNFLRRTVSRQLITVLELIGLFILLVACMNFINLSTAQSINRAKEIGVRKVLGSSKSQLQFQIYCETSLIGLFSILTSIVLVHFALPFIKGLLQLPLYLNLAEKDIYLFLIVLFPSVVFLATFYPALVISGFKVVTAIKSKLYYRSGSSISLRKVLVITQFVIAQVLIIGTAITIKQMNYFQSASMGFTKESIIRVPFRADSVSLAKLDVLKTMLLANTSIKHVSFSFGSPAEKGSWQSEFTYAGQSQPTDFPANLKWADADYLKTYDLQLIAGRNYHKSDTTQEVIVSEELVKRLGLSNPATIINKELSFWKGQLKVVVVGVIKDFHSQSLHEPIAPVIIGNRKTAYRVANIQLQPDNIAHGVSHVEKLWKDVFPEATFDHHFIDDALTSFYKQEQQLSHLFQVFAAIAIFLSCLGLYGLVAFMAAQRQKEVGIRKVLGASAQTILWLFSKEFIVLIAIAFLIAVPAALYIMNSWIQHFAFRTELSWWLFAIGGLITLAIALTTISFQALKAAVSNPTKNLRAE
jgi:putative ABC transport system permease protein